MQWRSVRDTNCSVARALSVIGERWTMLILREAFLGRRRFDEFQEGIGIARNILSTRLQALVSDEILERTASPEGHIEYRLTKKGLDFYPVLIAMMRWGDTWMAGEEGPPLTLTHRDCGHKTAPFMVCSHCHEQIDARAMQAQVAESAGRRRTREARARRPHETY
jgi:DNA-binding HxlR family transcriptional regulator